MTNQVQTKETEQSKLNVFDKMAQEQQSNSANTPAAQPKPTVSTPAPQTVEFDIADLDDIPVGDKVSYTRESLDGHVVVVDSVRIFPGDATPGSDDRTTSQKGDTEMVRMQFLVTFDAKNKDGLNHREYYSGARQFVQKDGSLSQPSFWYESADDTRKSQVAKLWEVVAAHKNIGPDKLSNREFVAFLNNKPKVKIAYQKQAAYPGTKPVSKNIIVGIAA